MSETVIRVENLKKTYRRYKTNFQKIQYLLAGKDAGEKVVVLRDVSFEIKRGEKVGIIGRTMTPGSSLLHILADVVQPDSGLFTIDGRVTAVLDNRLGFDNSLSGHDNYEIRCRLLGWNKEMIKAREQDVFEFAGLAKDIDKPIKTYKKAGIARLGFTISTEIKPDILLYDDALNFGSAKYNAKCIARLKELIAGEDTTFIMNVADKKVAAQLCGRGIIIWRGEIVFDGPYEDALAYYSENCTGAVSTGGDILELQEPQEEEAAQEEQQDNMDDDGGEID